MLNRRRERWELAVAKLDMQGITFGGRLTKEWLYEAFDITLPDPKVMMGDVVDRLTLEYGTSLKAFRDHIREKKMMVLQNIYGDGYVIVHPGDQTAFSEEKYFKRLEELQVDHDLNLKNIRKDMLTDEQAKDNQNARSVSRSIAEMIDRQKRRKRPF